MNNKYGSIINLPHHKSKNHPPMSIEQRAAQFAPFSALTGYNEEIIEVSRITDEKINISDELRNMINDKLNYIKKNISSNPKIEIEYFIKDKTKKGGRYENKISNVKKIDIYNKKIILMDDIKINFDDIISININV